MIIEISTIGQIIGFIALFFVFLAFKETDDRKLIIYLAIGSGIWGVHFGVLGLVAASAINFFDVLKNCIGLKYKKNNYWVSFFVATYIAIGIMSYSYSGSLVSFLPTIASVLGAIAVFWFSGIPLRLIMMSTLFVWFTYNIIGGSYAGMASDIALIGASFYGIFKLKRSTIHSLKKEEK